MKEGNILIHQKLYKHAGGETFIPLEGPIF